MDRFMKYFVGLYLPAIKDTLLILVGTLILAFVAGFLLSIILILTRKEGLRPHKLIYKATEFIVDFIRSFPIMIMIVALIPMTRAVMGTALGVRGAIFPLAIAGSAYMARMFESAMLEVDPQLIEAATSFGASEWQIIIDVVIKEAVPAIISGTTLAAVMFLSSTTVAGAIGAGGLGSVAMNYGYYRFDDMILYTGVVILFIFVQIIQLIGKGVYKKFDLKSR